MKSGMTEFSTDTNSCDIFLESLPYSLKDIKRDFNLLRAGERDFTNLQAIYLQELRERAASSARASELTAGIALYAGTHGQQRGGRGGFRGTGGGIRGSRLTGNRNRKSTSTPPNTCFNCGQEGHWRGECPLPPKAEKRGPAALAKKENRKERGWMMPVMEGVEEIQRLDLEHHTMTWVVDSGATHHLTSDKKILSNIVPLPQKMVFNVAGSGNVTAIETGIVITAAPSGKRIILSDVYHLPGGRNLLLSISTLYALGWRVYFTATGGQIRRKLRGFRDEQIRETVDGDTTTPIIDSEWPSRLSVSNERQDTRGVASRTRTYGRLEYCQARQGWKGRWIKDCRRLIIYRRQMRHLHDKQVNSTHFRRYSGSGESASRTDPLGPCWTVPTQSHWLHLLPHDR